MIVIKSEKDDTSWSLSAAWLGCIFRFSPWCCPSTEDLMDVGIHSTDSREIMTGRSWNDFVPKSPVIDTSSTSTSHY